MHITH